MQERVTESERMGVKANARDSVPQSDNEFWSES